MRTCAASRASLCDDEPRPVTRSRTSVRRTPTRQDDDHQGDAFDPEAGRKDPEFGTYRKEGVSAGAIALIVVAVLLVIFVLQNDEQHTVSFLIWHPAVRTWAALLVAAVLGFVVGFGVHWLLRRRR
jgi:uncharacterized integral membrane protein